MSYFNGVSAKFSSLKGEEHQVENLKYDVFEFRLILLDRLTYVLRFSVEHTMH